MKITHLKNIFEPDNVVSVVSKVSTISKAVEVITNKVGFNRPTVAWSRGRYWLRKEWNEVLHNDDSVVFISFMAGGGLSNEGSKVLRSVLTIAVLALSLGYGAPLAAAIGFGGAAAAGIASAVIGLAGAALVNLILPPPKPLSAIQGEEYVSASYSSIRGKGNFSKLGEVIVSAYGKNKTFPDISIPPYRVIEVDDEGNVKTYIVQQLVVGIGYYDIESLYMGETIIYSDGEAIEGYEIEKLDPNELGTIITNIVVPYDVSFTPVALEYTATATGSLYGILNNYRNYDTSYGDFISELDAIGKGPPLFTKPYILGKNPKSNFNRLVVSTNSVNSKTLRGWRTYLGLAFRRVDESNEPIESWRYFLDKGEYLQGYNTTTFDFGVAGRWEIKFFWYNTEGSGVSYLSILDFRGEYIDFINEDSTETAKPDVTVISMKIDEDYLDDLNTVNRVSVVSKRKIFIWEEGLVKSDERVFSSNPAWIAADILLSSIGGKLDISKLDMDRFYSLSLTWEERNDLFNGVFDSKFSVWEAVSLVVRVGRAVPILLPHFITLVRDEPSDGLSMLVTPASIVKDSLSYFYEIPNSLSCDLLRVNYIDSSSWLPDSVEVSLSGEECSNIVSVDLFGCTDAYQARREGRKILLDNAYRRKTVIFSLEMEGRLLLFGSTVRISHPSLSNGSSGVVENFEDGVFTLSNDLPNPKENHLYLALRSVTGFVMNKVAKVSIAGTKMVRLVDKEDFSIDFNSEYKDKGINLIYVLGDEDSYAVEARVKGVKYKKDFQMEVTAVVEDERVHEDSIGLLSQPLTFSDVIVSGHSGSALNSFTVTRYGFSLFDYVGRPSNPVKLSVKFTGNQNFISSHILFGSGFSIHGFHEDSIIELYLGFGYGSVFILGSPGLGGTLEANDGTDGREAIFNNCCRLVIKSINGNSGIYGGGGGGGSSQGWYSSKQVLQDYLVTNNYVQDNGNREGAYSDINYLKPIQGVGGFGAGAVRGSSFRSVWDTSFPNQIMPFYNTSEGFEGLAAIYAIWNATHEFINDKIESAVTIEGIAWTGGEGGLMSRTYSSIYGSTLYSGLSGYRGGTGGGWGDSGSPGAWSGGAVDFRPTTLNGQGGAGGKSIKTQGDNASVLIDDSVDRSKIKGLIS